MLERERERERERASERTSERGDVLRESSGTKVRGSSLPPAEEGNPGLLLSKLYKIKALCPDSLNPDSPVMPSTASRGV